MPCSGTPTSCAYHDFEMCEWCGCYWDDSCKGTAWACNVHGDQTSCENCGCDWTVPGINIKINIGDVWKDASEMKINIGDVWKNVTEIWINIGDVWKRVF